MTEQDILDLIKKDQWMMDLLRTAQSLHLPDWWIGAGFVRSTVWDHLHGFTTRTPIPDIDVIYFDKNEVRPEVDWAYDDRLRQLNSSVEWQVRNQARMHLKKGDAPYKDSADGLSKWVEIATCIGVKLKDDGSLELLAPHGIDDLVNLRVTANPLCIGNPELFNQRMDEKGWDKKWPKLKIVKS